MSLKGEDALILAMDYADRTMAGAGGLKGDPGASAYEIAIANGFEGSEKEWLESLKASVQIDEDFDSSSKNPLSNDVITAEFKNIANNKQDKLTFDETPTLGSTKPVISGGVYNFVPSAAKKLETPINIGKASFDGSSNINLSSIMGRALSDSSGTKSNYYTKFATVTLTLPWDSCVGVINIISVENPNVSGQMMFFIRTQETTANTVIKLNWISLNDMRFVDSIVAVKISDGVYDLYFRAVNMYSSTVFTLIDCNNPDKIQFHNKQSYVDTVTPVATSSYNIDTVPTAGSTNHITSGGVRTAIDEALNGVAIANEVEHSTTKTWLDGNKIYRKDFAWEITGLTINQDNVVYLTSLMANAVQTSMYITDANMIVQGDATISNIHCDNTGYKIKVNPTTTEIVITGFIEYVLGDYSSYTNYTTTT